MTDTIFIVDHALTFAPMKKKQKKMNNNKLFRLTMYQQKRAV